MQIRTPTTTRTIYDSDIMDGEYPYPGIEFNDNGEATVRREVGRALAEKYPGIEVVGDESDRSAESAVGDERDSGGGPDEDLPDAPLEREAESGPDGGVDADAETGPNEGE